MRTFRRVARPADDQAANWGNPTETMKKDGAKTIREYYPEDVVRYDSLGSLVKETIAPATAYEASQMSKYLVDEEGVIYGVTKTDAKGTQTRFITDGMERVVRKGKQDAAQHDASTAVSMFRVMQKNSYDAVGQRVQVDKMDWFIQDHQNTPQEILTVERIEYDDWGTI
ncbi:RHS repeat [Fusarium coicis]|nr:RHS repeat [Fusarium coicis]